MLAYYLWLWHKCSSIHHQIVSKTHLHVDFFFGGRGGWNRKYTVLLICADCNFCAGPVISHLGIFGMQPNKLTHTMEQNCSTQTDSLTGTRNYPFSYSLKFSHCAHRSMPFVPILSQMHSIHTHIKVPLDLFFFYPNNCTWNSQLFSLFQVFPLKFCSFSFLSVYATCPASIILFGVITRM